MKGVVFNIFEDFVEESFGDAAWSDLLDESNMSEEVFISINSYDDAILIKLIGKVVDKYSLEMTTLTRNFGKFAFPRLVRRIPGIASSFKSSKEFLKGLDSIIHIEVQKLFAGAETPRFYFVEEGNDLILDYVSKRQLTYFALGLIDGLGGVYSESLDVELLSSSEDKSRLRVSFEG